MTKREFKSKFIWPISVSIERLLYKLRVKIDKLYRKTWVLIYILILLPYIGYGAWRIYYDYSLIHNYANFEALNESVYSSWNTDGKPGCNPPQIEVHGITGTLKSKK